MANYKKRIQTYRISLSAIILLEKISIKDNRTITNAFETSIFEKAESLGLTVTDDEIEEKHKEFEEQEIRKKEEKKK